MQTQAPDPYSKRLKPSFEVDPEEDSEEDEARQARRYREPKGNRPEGFGPNEPAYTKDGRVKFYAEPWSKTARARVLVDDEWVEVTEKVYEPVKKLELPYLKVKEGLTVRAEGVPCSAGP